MYGFQALAALLAGLVLLIGAPAGHRPVHSATGADPGQRVQVIDGDTLEVDGRVVQLYGIDAPELGQRCARGESLWPCGVDAAHALNKLVSLGEQPVVCAPWQQQEQSGSGNETAQVCELGERNLALTMLRAGYSVALPDSFPDYGEAEKEARAAKLGIWQGEFVAPWEWRASTGPEVEADVWARDCNVKGSITLGGRQVYYVPTDEAYQDLAVDPARGERLFCSDEAARAAGWTRPDYASPSD